MNCTAFRERHYAFMDGELEPVEQSNMQQHLAECAACAAHDSVVRRAILLARNLPLIEPSADFTNRLEARLGALSTRPWDRWSARTQPYVATAIGFAAVAYLAVLAFRQPARDPISAFRPIPIAADAPGAAPYPAAARVAGVSRASDSIGPLSITPVVHPMVRQVGPRGGPSFVALRPFSVEGSVDSFETRLPNPPIMPFGRVDLPGSWARRLPPPPPFGSGMSGSGGGFTAVRLTQ